MPVKVCPKCNLRHGCRRLTCECGHVFGVKPTSKPTAATDKFPYPEPGVWIWDQPRGMPPLNAPDPLPPGPVSNETVAEHVCYDGLGFTIYSLIPVDRIEDPKLRKLWVEARSAMQKIVEYLG